MANNRKARKQIKTTVRAISNALYGAGTVVQLWPDCPTMRKIVRSPDGRWTVRSSSVPVHCDHGYASDCEAMQSDWVRIGGDVKVALAKWRRDYEKKG